MGEYRTSSGQVIRSRQGDLTQEDVDAVVNAANSHLQHGGGVAGAIVRWGGQVIQDESDRWVRDHGPVPTGQVALTGAGKLNCRRVIHAVGPIWRDGRHQEPELLRAAVWNSLLAAHEAGLKSIALPAVSSGIFGFPKERCASILVRTALEFCEQRPDSPLREIRFTNVETETAGLFEAEVRALAATA